MPEAAAYAAVDLGASGGRIFTGSLADGCVVLREVHRFPNRPVALPDGLRWDLVHLYAEALGALRAAGPLRGIGVNTWGVDYGLLDARGRLLDLPFHYRDARTEGMPRRAFERVPREELYALTGIQTMAINTAFQLLADVGSPALAEADRLVLIPDLLAFWLTGELANERTVASTTGLLGATSGEWAREAIERLGLPGRIFGELVDPGTALGPARRDQQLGPVTVFAVAGHDTASAFAAAPLRDEHDAVLSSGTWSLLGLELPTPVLTDVAREENLTNERGVEGTTRLLRNVMGLWLEQECARVWGADHVGLFRAAAAASPEVPLFDPDDERFISPCDDMPERITAACASLGQRPPRTRGETIRSILTSLACKYRLVLESLEAAADCEVRRIHVIGGGARIALLCQLTADVTRREVLAGPTEATAIGNILVQARSSGELGSLQDMRAVAAATADPIAYGPADDAGTSEASYRRFLSLTGLTLRAPRMTGDDRD